MLASNCMWHGCFLTTDIATAASSHMWQLVKQAFSPSVAIQLLLLTHLLYTVQFQLSVWAALIMVIIATQF